MQVAVQRVARASNKWRPLRVILSVSVAAAAGTSPVLFARIVLPNGGLTKSLTTSLCCVDSIDLTAGVILTSRARI